MHSRSIVHWRAPRVVLALVPALALAIAPASVAAPLTPLQIEKQETIYTGKTAGSRRATAFSDAAAFDQGTRRSLRASDETLPVFSTPGAARHYFVLVARIPSKKPQAMGYCGAGYEDHLLLLAYDGTRTILRDDFLLQSCLQNRTLDTGDSDDILHALTVDSVQSSIRFRWLGDTGHKNHLLSIANGKFLLD